MDLLIAPGTVDVSKADTAPTTGTPGWATDGDPVNLVPRTVLPAYAFNSIQAEIYNVLLGAGLTPDRNNNKQLWQAISQIATGSDSAFMPIDGGAFTGLVTGLPVTNWATRQLINALDADVRYFKNSGGTVTNGYYDSVGLWGTTGENNTAQAGDIPWGPQFVSRISYLSNAKFLFCLRDSYNEYSFGSLQLTDNSKNFYEWQFRSDGYIYGPDGTKLAKISDVTAFFAATAGVDTRSSITNIQAVNFTAGTSNQNTYMQVATALGTFAVPSVEYLSNAIAAAIAGKQPTGNYITGSESGWIIEVFSATVTRTGTINLPRTYSEVLAIVPQQGTDGNGICGTNIVSNTNSTAQVNVGSYHTGAFQSATITQNFIVIGKP
ncbi:hypothetical protein ACJRO0_09745 [Acetobacter oryzifermentans]|uniref:hypothetical protein n=1 Tax=Acetobacter oryzifermentans TaxID=1633874 RepID=UPI0039BF9C80